MERISVQQKHTKHARITKKRPFKVVYISNPVKFTASADQFRFIVQQLTGMDSNIDDFTDHAPGLQVTDLRENPKYQTADDTMYRQRVPEQFDYVSNEYFYGDFATENEMFGDLSSICYDSILCRTHDHIGDQLS